MGDSGSLKMSMFAGDQQMTSQHMQGQFELDDELLNPCCAQDRKDMQMAAQRDRVLKAHDITRNAIDSRFPDSHRILQSQSMDAEQCCAHHAGHGHGHDGHGHGHGSHMSSVIDDRVAMEKPVNDDEGCCSDASLDSIDKLLMEDDQDELVLQRMAAARLNESRLDASKVSDLPRARTH